MARFKPQAEANSSSKGSVGHACETGKPQQDSSARGVQFVPRRAAETASSKPLKAKQNHGKPWQDSSLKRKPIPPCKGFCGACMRNRETPAGFKRKGWSIRPLTRCRNSIFETVKSKTMANPGKSQAPSGSQFLLKGLGGACMRNRETPAGFKRKGWSIRPRQAAETASSKPLKAKQNHGKPWQDSSPKRKPIPPQRVLWGMHAKQGNPSRIRAQGVVNSSPDALPFVP